MFRVLRFSAKATLAEVARAVQRAPGRRIALVFPLGVRSRLADTGRMDALAALCRERHKEATVVGGDELLRACAVACGMRAAVTLDDWREARPRRTTRKPLRTIQPRLVVVSPQASRLTVEYHDTDVDSLDVEPPEYVQELLALHRRTAESLADQALIAVRLPFVVAARTTTLAYDLDSDDLPRALAEDDEERLTATIRRTSGLDEDELATCWLTSVDSVEAVEAAAPDGQTSPR